MWIIEQVLPIGQRQDVRLKRKAIDLKALARNGIWINWLCWIREVQVWLRWIIDCRVIEDLGNKILQVGLRNIIQLRVLDVGTQWLNFPVRAGIQGVSTIMIS